MPEDKIPDWEGKRYLGELVRFHAPFMYGQPVYYTNGTRIPYLIEIPKIASLTVEDFTNAQT